MSLTYRLERYAADGRWHEVAATSDEPHAHSLLATFALTNPYGRSGIYRLRNVDTDEILATIGEQP